MTLQEVLKVVEESMVKTCNFYAKEGNMLAATAIHDAYLCVEEALTKEKQMKRKRNTEESDKRNVDR